MLNSSDVNDAIIPVSEEIKSINETPAKLPIFGVEFFSDAFANEAHYAFIGILLAKSQQTALKLGIDKSLSKNISIWN